MRVVVLGKEYHHLIHIYVKEGELFTDSYGDACYTTGECHLVFSFLTQKK